MSNGRYGGKGLVTNSPSGESDLRKWNFVWVDLEEELQCTILWADGEAMDRLRKADGCVV